MVQEVVVCKKLKFKKSTAKLIILGALKILYKNVQINYTLEVDTVKFNCSI